MKKLLSNFLYWLRKGYAPGTAWDLAKKTL